MNGEEAATAPSREVIVCDQGTGDCAGTPESQMNKDSCVHAGMRCLGDQRLATNGGQVWMWTR